MTILQAHCNEYCPNCNRPLIKYKRRINQGMKQFLINLYSLNKNEPEREHFHFREIITIKSGSLDYAMLEKFQLVERKGYSVSSPHCAGFWKINALGKSFVENKVSVPKFLFIFLGEVVSESKERVFINQIGKDKFNLEEVMQISEN